MGGEHALDSCSTQARISGSDPIGTIGTVRGYLLVEWPLPWPADMREVPELLPIIDAVGAVGIRFQAVVGERDSRGERVVLHRFDTDGATESLEWVPPAGRLVGVLERIASELAAGIVPLCASPVTTNDVLVCTHGRRDRCCGTHGMRLYSELVHELGSDADTRVFRTSHLGGHRFAPTLVILPEGTGWAHADLDLVTSVLRRRGTATDAMPRFRGSAGLSTPEAQVLERELARRLGWCVFDGQCVERAPSDRRVAIDVVHPDGRRYECVGSVLPLRESPIPICGSTPGATSKTQTEFGVGNVRVRIVRGANGDTS